MPQHVKRSKFGYVIGILVSLVLHLMFAFIALLLLHRRATAVARQPEVFTVTLEGGERIGGVSQAPKDDAPPKKAPLELPDSSEQAQEKTDPAEVEPPKEEKKLEQPSAVEDVEKKAEEAKLKAELEKKQAEQEKEKKLKAEEAKKQAELDKNKAEDEAKKKEEEKLDKDKRKKAFEQRLNAIRRGITQNYDGESANAGGQGIGAAKTGGKGYGGGTLVAVEKLAYMNALEAHVKRGWHWIMGGNKLSAVVHFRILPNGEVQNVRLESSSGVTNFDDSALRAVNKASPVPPPPEKFYNELSDVRITFDSKQ